MNIIAMPIQLILEYVENHPDFLFIQSLIYPLMNSLSIQVTNLGSNGSQSLEK